MYLGTKKLQRGNRVLIIDDFMRGGSTASGMLLVVKEFMAEVAGVGFFMTSSEPETKAISHYSSLLTLRDVHQDNPKVEVSL
jgi:purine operon repressor